MAARRRLRDDPALAPISARQAAAILSDGALRAQAERVGLDLGLLVANLRVPVDERLRRHRGLLRMQAVFREAGRRAGLGP